MANNLPMIIPPMESDDDLISNDSSIIFFMDLIEQVDEEDMASSKRVVKRDREKGQVDEEDTASSKRVVKCDREKGFCGEITMDMQIQGEPYLIPAVKATLCLGSETHTLEACKGILSDQLVYVKGESMSILKEFITKHNVLNDVPDEIVSEGDADDDDMEPIVKSKKLRTEK